MPPSELLGRKIDILLEQATMPFARLRWRRRRRQGRGQSLQVIGRRKQGRPACFDVSSARWRADERDFVTTIWRDVTERMAAEDALRESESHHRALLEALPQLVWTCGPGGDCDYFNPQWQAYTGAPREAAPGMGLDRGYPRIRPRGSAGRVEVFTGKGRPIRCRRTPATRGLHSPLVQDAIHPGAGSGRENHAVVRYSHRHHRSHRSARCVAPKQRRAGGARRSSARASGRWRFASFMKSQKMETIGQLTGGVAHDFNNLLAVILGSLALLKKRLPDDPRTLAPAGGRDAGRGTRRDADQAAAGICTAPGAQARGGRGAEARSRNAGFPAAIRRSQHLDQGRHICPTCSRVKIDANQLELALMNLAVNARDAMPKGGSLTITCRNEATRRQNDVTKALPRGEYVRIERRRYRRGHERGHAGEGDGAVLHDEGDRQGHGLGLSMVHGLAAQSGGAMHISSQLGKGTVVTLWLPRARPEDVPRAPEPQTAPSTEFASRELRILLVDDDVSREHEHSRHADRSGT